MLTVDFTPGISEINAVLKVQGRDIKSGTQYKYLGVEFSNHDNYLVTQQKIVRDKAIKYKNMLQAKGLWAYSRFDVIRTLWKSVAVPGLTYGNAVLRYDPEVVKFLDQQQRDVRIIAIGCHGRSANEFVQGEWLSGYHPYLTIFANNLTYF